MGKLCDYGCGKEAIYEFKNGKWCCANNPSKCPNIISRIRIIKKNNCSSDEFKMKMRKITSDRYKDENQRKLHSKKMKRIYNDKIRRKEISLRQRERYKNKNEREKAKELALNRSTIPYKRTIKKTKQKYTIFTKEEEIRYNPDKPGEKEIQVHCKNHNCPNSKEQGGWFTPHGRQFESRLWALENKNGNDGCYFYCCEECKKTCIIYNLRSDPFKNDEKVYTQEEINMWKQTILEQDNYECQKCGSKENLHCHHINPVKTHPHMALDPDNGIVLCQSCHYKYGHKDECSTGNLTKENSNCKMGK